MAVNLIDLAKGLFTQDTITKASTNLNESESGIRKAIDVLVPTLLAGLLSKGQSSGGTGLGSLLDKAKALLGGGDVHTMLGNAIGNTSAAAPSGEGAAIVNSLLNDHAGAVSQQISGYSGIKESSAHALLNTAAPAVLSLTAAQASTEGRFGDSGLWAYLMTQKDHILASLPSGFNIAGLLGLGGIAAAPRVAPINTSSYREENRKKSGGGWLWLLLLVLIGLALWYFLGQKGCNKGDEHAMSTDTTSTTPKDSMTAAPLTTSTRESIKVQLPDGTELNAYKGGIEDQLVSFLKTDYKALGPDSLKKIWFDFDNLNFETGKASITTESQAQIANLTAILKAFPKAKLKIGGYTDKTGNESANVKLSRERALAVKDALAKAGVGAQVEGADGYGSQFAKSAADAPEAEKVKDRHVSVSVRD